MMTVPQIERGKRQRLSRQIVRVLTMLQMLWERGYGMTALEIYEEARNDPRFNGCSMRTIYRDLDAAVYAGAIQMEAGDPVVYRPTAQAPLASNPSAEPVSMFDTDLKDVVFTEWIQLHWWHKSRRGETVLVAEGGPFRNADEGLAWLEIAYLPIRDKCPDGWRWTIHDSFDEGFQRADPELLNRPLAELYQECQRIESEFALNA